MTWINNKFKKLQIIKQKTEKKRTNLYIISSELYNNFLEIWYDEYNELSDAKKRKLVDNYNTENLFFKTYDYSAWSEN